MSIEKSVSDKLLRLPRDKQKEVLEFVDALAKQSRFTGSRRSLKGLWSGLGADVTEEDITEARREMWGHVSRASKHSHDHA
jgi:hypothetical protein